MLADFLAPPLHYKIAEPWMWERPVSLAEEQLIERAVDKRKREFRAGRHAAHHLFDQLGIHHPDLLKGVQREPAWPDGWVGSISHTQGFCIAMLAAAQDFKSVGLDVELATPLNPDLHGAICLPEELRAISDVRKKVGLGLPLEKLVFSAKESIHKTYFPLNQYTLDFLDARIELDWENQQFDAWIINPEPAPRHPISHLKGKFMFYQDWILTCITLPA